MNNEYKVSICIPIYNVSQYIERCARSIFEQTYSNWEAIFVNDCSPDNSVEILERTVQDYPILRDKFRLLNHEQNRGLAAARNTGVDAAKGDFIMHVDSDDWLELNAVEVLVKRQQETDADIVSGNAIQHKKTEDVILKEPEYSNIHEMCMKMVELELDHAIWRRLIRRSLYTDNNIHAIEGINIGEDHHTLPRLCYYAKTVAKVDDIVYHYNCLNENSLISDSSKSKFNYRIYTNDRDSGRILLNFFKDKDIDVYNHLLKIYTERIDDMYRNTAFKGDWKAFKFVSQDVVIQTSRIRHCYQFFYFRTQYYIMRIEMKIKDTFKVH